MNLTRSVGTNRGEEVLRLESVCNVVQFLAITSKEECACSWSISNSDNVSLDKSRTVGRGSEGLVVSAISIRRVRDRGLVVSCDTGLV